MKRNLLFKDKNRPNRRKDRPNNKKDLHTLESFYIGITDSKINIAKTCLPKIR